jgi:hypothetical protein
MIGNPPTTTLKDRNLEQATIMSLKREPACFAFLCSGAILPPMPIDAINLDLASADYFEGRASLWTTLEVRSTAMDDRPTAVLGFDEAFLRPFTRALIEAATTRVAYRMSIVPTPGKVERCRVVEYVTGPGTTLREIILTPHDNVILVGAAVGDDDVEETLFQLPRSDSFQRSFTKMTFQADRALRDTLADMERIARDQSKGRD